MQEWQDMLSAFMVYESLDTMSSFTALMRNINIAVTKTKEIMDMPPMDIDGEDMTPNKRDTAPYRQQFC